MSNLIHHSQCPVCGSNQIVFALAAKDYTVSQEEFAVWHCNDCGLRFTQDVPDADSIYRYYQSEEYISHSDTGKGLINRLYHLIRKRTLSGKRKLVQQSTGIKNGNILDVGSGTGAFLNEMKQAGWQTTGLEPDPGARQMAVKLYQLELKNADELFGLVSGNFDAITLWHVLEHVHQLHDYMQQLKTLLKPGGKLFIAVPNYTSYDAGIYKNYWAAYDVPRHLYHFSPVAMKTLLEKYGLKIISCKPMWYDSFYVSLLSSKYKNGKTNFLGAGRTGLVSNLKTLLNGQKSQPDSVSSSVIYIISK